MKKYSHFIILFSLSLLIILAVFSIYFLYQKVQNTLNTQERAKLEQEIQNDRIKNLPDLEKRYQSILSSEQYFSVVYPEDKVVDIIKDIERIAKEQQVTLVITQKEVPKKKAAAAEESGQGRESAEAAPKELVDTLPYEKSIRLELRAEGQYQALRTFLHAIETAPYALDVLALTGSVAPPEDGNSPVTRQPNDSPFLLSGTPVEETPAPQLNTSKIIFLIETALYIQ